MTNKVKPFYIRITDDMTPQMAHDAINKCRRAGVKDTELDESLHHSEWNYLGVCVFDGLCYSDYRGNFQGGAKEITLDQLDEWLGIAGSSPKQVEWNNGDEVEYGNDISMSPCWTGRYVCFDNAKGKHIIENDNGLWHISESCIRKPETPEQKAERERLEAAYDVYLAFWSASESTIITMSMIEFKECTDLKYWLAVVDKTSYRKQ